MTFKFFDHMENIFGDRKTVQGQSTISSTFAKKNPKSKSSTMPAKASTMSTFKAHSDTSIEMDDEIIDHLKCQSSCKYCEYQ